jgi:hypothetical protein
MTEQLPMKQSILFALLLFSSICNGQQKIKKNISLLTTKYAGAYSYGTNAEKGSVGAVDIFPETDSTILFYIELNRGVPSYNSGALYGRLKIKDGTGIFYKKSDYTDSGCKWAFKFSGELLNIKTADNQYDCGFGHAVFADGNYKRGSNKISDSFINREGKTTYFKATTPEQYSE